MEFFKDFTQQESLLFLLFLIGAFLIGFLLAWLLWGGQAATWRRAAQKAQGELNSLQAEYQSFQAQYELKEADLLKAQIELDDMRRRQRQFQDERNALAAELSSLRADSAAYQSTIDDLNDQIVGLKAKNAHLVREIETEMGPVAAPTAPPEWDSALRRIAELEQKVQSLVGAQTQAAAPPEADDHAENVRLAREWVMDRVQLAQAKDDLQQIEGIGPFLEKKLNEVGIVSFEQVAALDDSLIEQLTAAIEFFPGRIQKDDWVGQAAKLLANR